MESNFIKPRRPWLAGLLSLTGVPIGQLYAGHARRAFILWIACSVLLPLAVYPMLFGLAFSKWVLLITVSLLLAVQLFFAVDAFLLARRDRLQPLQRFQRWWVYLLAYVTALFIGGVNSELIRSYVCEAFIVPTGSMAPTVQNYDRILVDKFFLDASQLKRNDVAVYLNSEPNAYISLKRVMGLPGETVEIRDEKLFINEEPVPDEFAAFNETDHPLIPELANYGPVTIPAGSYFVLGDNRRNSLDSRMHGLVTADKFQGIARLIYWSNDYTFVDSPLRPSQPPKPVRGDIRWDRIGKRLDH